MEEEELVSAAEAATLLSVTRQTIGTWDEQGILCPVLRLGTQRFRGYKKADVDRLRREREQRAATEEAGNRQGSQQSLGAAAKGD